MSPILIPVQTQPSRHGSPRRRGDRWRTALAVARELGLAPAVLLLLLGLAAWFALRALARSR